MRFERVQIKPCPDGNRDHGLVHTDAGTARQLGLAEGTLLHIDRRRAPASGDVVLVEMVVHEYLTRTLRRFTEVGQVVSLARLDGQTGSVIRPRHEVGILGVVDGRIAPLSQKKQPFR